MRLVLNKRESRKKVVTVTEKRRVVVTFDDPLEPGVLITYNKTFTIKNGKVLNYPDVYNYLDLRYCVRIGECWKTYNTTDHGYKNGLQPIPISEQNARRKLVDARNGKVQRTAREVNDLIRQALEKK